MNDTELISVIVPIYNVENYLDKCIESIVQQSYQNLEIILVNDGSTDGSRIICEKYAAADSRIKVINKQNGGPSSARNAGFKAATGEFIMAVDGDDWIESCMCHDLLKILKQTSADFVDSGFIKEMFTKSEHYSNLSDGFFNLDNTRTELMDAYFRGEAKFIQSIGGKLYRAALVKRLCLMIPVELYIGEDFLWLCFLLGNAHTAVTTSKAYYHYVQRKTSYCNSISLFSIVEHYRIMSGFREIIKRNYPAISMRNVDFWIVNVCFNRSKLVMKNLFPNSFFFKNISLLIGKKIIVYGAGTVGQCYVGQLSRYEAIHIVAWVDKNYTDISFDYRHVSNVDCIPSLHYDYVLIATNQENVASNIRTKLISLSVPNDKIIWELPGKVFDIEDESIQ